LTQVLSWGRAFKAESEKHPFHSWESLLGKNLVTGSQLSYGDSCLIDGGRDLSNLGRDNILNFQPEEMWIEAQSGITFDRLLQFLVPRGFFLPVTPGTKYITLGGALANDVHGKNHHSMGSFGCHVLEFRLLRSSGEVFRCSPQEHSDLFHATVGGLGLTGAILSVKFKIVSISSSFIDNRVERFRGLSQFFELSEKYASSTYTVSWIDCYAKWRGRAEPRGLFMAGQSSQKGDLRLHKSPRIKVPIALPFSMINGVSSRVFNHLYYSKSFLTPVQSQQHYDPFFYPLDGVLNWNLVYGSKGFFQFQCVLPMDRKEKLQELLDLIAESGQGSFLSVLKLFGSIPSVGWMSFPREGVTLCLDFPNLGSSTRKLFSQMEKMVLNHGGRLYPAKDMLMKGESFKTFYPNWEKFNQIRDPQFESSFWKRVMEKKI